MKKYYYITAEIAEEMPSYDFVLEAQNEQEARDIAHNIIANDYEDYKKFDAHELARGYSEDHNGREAGFELLQILKLN